MKRLSTLLAFAFAVWLQTTCRKPGGEIHFNHDWQFIISDLPLNEVKIPDDQWSTVDLPHTPVLEPRVIEKQWQGICWYRKQFRLPGESTDKQVYLKFDGAMNQCDVWINGSHAISKAGGYLPVVSNISPFLFHDSINTVLVRLDNQDNPVTGPKPLAELDFNMYGGLYRDAHLMVKNTLHITDPIEANQVAGGGIFVTYPLVTPQKATVHIKTHVKNAGNSAKSFRIIQKLTRDDKIVSETKSSIFSLESQQADHFEMTIDVKNPELWSPFTPSLYTLITRVVSEGKITDEVKTTIGIRHIEISIDGFRINGEKLFLLGVNRHQEYPYIGYALSNHAQYRDARKIKEAGFDYVRLSHYPHSPAFLSACDELGLVVLNAILGWQYYTRDSAFQNHVLTSARELVRRDRNHPCVIAWELSLNESWMDEYFIDQLHAIAHEEYPGSQCYSAGWQEYGYDIYLQARQHRLEHYHPPTKPYIVSEYGDWEYYAMNAGLNQDRWEDLLPHERSSRQLLSDGEVRLLQQVANIQEAHNDNLKTPAFADGYWVMFDYNRGYAPDLEASGIMSIDRIPKFSYYFFKSQRPPHLKSDNYESGPMVHIVTWWTDDSPVPVTVFSNCQQVELFLNGKSFGRHSPIRNALTDMLPFPPFVFELKQFEPGELKANGYIDGKIVASHALKTPGVPVALRLVPDFSGRPWTAGCNDAIFIYAMVEDENATIVPVNSIEVTFEVNGDAMLVHSPVVSTEAGIAAALVVAGRTHGNVTIKAISKDLRAGLLTLKTKQL